MTSTLPQLSEVDRLLILHALGLNRGIAAEPYRNRYCAATADSETVAALDGLCERGLMVRGQAINNGRSRLYHVTEAGAAAVGSHLPTDD